MPGSAAPPELRRLVPGAEWKADIALTLADGNIQRAGELLFSNQSEEWWAGQRARQEPAAQPQPSPEQMLARASAAPEWKCRIALAQSLGDANRAFEFVTRHAAETDDWWRSQDPGAAQPSKGAVPQPAAAGAALALADHGAEEGVPHIAGYEQALGAKSAPEPKPEPDAGSQEISEGTPALAAKPEPEPDLAEPHEKREQPQPEPEPEPESAPQMQPEPEPEPEPDRTKPRKGGRRQPGEKRLPSTSRVPSARS
eukprot:COSAG04_NODE_796_length_10256_cov_46.383479_7_plen_255_part_00